jgi:hypothetical protein
MARKRQQISFGFAKKIDTRPSSTIWRTSTMVGIQVWIASHFHAPIRFSWFIETIKSLAHQTVKPSLVAISYSEPPPPLDGLGPPYNVLGICKEYLSARSIDFIIMKAPKRKYQFEHLKILLDRIDPPDDTYIAVCDDDDIYAPNRIQKDLEIIKELEPPVLRCTFSIITGLVKYEDVVWSVCASSDYDFGCFTFKSHLLKEFFTSYGILDRNSPGCTDCVFTRRIVPLAVVLNETLYFKRGDKYNAMSYCWHLPNVS